MPTGQAISLTHRPQLPFAVRRQQAAAHVIRQTDPGNHRQNAVAVALRILQALQQEYARPFANHQAVGSRVERTAPPRWRQRPQLSESHLRIEAVGPRDAARQHGVGAAGEQLIGRQFERIEGGSARGVESIMAAAQAERFRQNSSRQSDGVTIARIDGLGWPRRA